MTIQQLLSEPGQQDKHENLSTTSFKFKTDLWNFFQGFEDKVCVEFGTHKGQTTKILSYLFHTVYTVNLPGHLDEAMMFNSDRRNIGYIGVDLYSNAQLGINDTVSVFFIDANHEYNCVLQDFDRVKEENTDKDCYVVFDDYGSDYGVNIAVKDLVEDGELEIIHYIGHERGHSFGGTPERILKDWEGVICKVKNT